MQYAIHAMLEHGRQWLQLHRFLFASIVMPGRGHQFLVQAQPPSVTVATLEHGHLLPRQIKLMYALIALVELGHRPWLPRLSFSAPIVKQVLGLRWLHHLHSAHVSAAIVELGHSLPDLRFNRASIVIRAHGHPL